MRFALVTDVHFGPIARHEGKLRKLSDQAGPLLDALVRQLEGERVDLVVNLGDVIEDESPSADRAHYQQFLQALAPLEAPLLHVAGNHDTIHLDDAALGALWGHTGPLYYARTIAGVRFVVLHSRETKDVSVNVSAAQLDWLKGELERASAPVVVLVHHPASEMQLGGNRWFEKAPQICRIAERRALRRVLEASGKVIAVFNGHAHWNHLDVIAGIPYVTLQSLTENLDDDAPGRAARAAAVCELGERRLLVRVLGEEPARYQLER